MTGLPDIVLNSRPADLAALEEASVLDVLPRGVEVGSMAEGQIVRQDLGRYDRLAPI